MSSDNANNDPLNFVKNMWENMGFSLPGMVTPSFDVEEIEKRIKDMKAVEGWLKMNLSMLQMTIQGLEMQCATLNAVHAMGNMQTQAPAETAAPEEQSAEKAPAQAGMWPWNMMQQMQDQMQQSATEQAVQATRNEEAPKRTARRKKTDAQ